MALTEARVWVLRGSNVPRLADLVFAHTPGGAAATQPTQWSGQQGYFNPSGADAGVAWVEFPTPRGFAEMRGRRRNLSAQSARLEIWGGPELSETRLLYVMDVPAGTAEEEFVLDLNKPPLSLPVLMIDLTVAPRLLPYTPPAPIRPVLLTPIGCRRGHLRHDALQRGAGSPSGGDPRRGVAQTDRLVPVGCRRGLQGGRADAGQGVRGRLLPH